MSSYKEAIIIPLALYKTATFAKETAPSILQLPIDQKLKIMEAEKYYDSAVKVDKQTIETKEVSLMKESIRNILDTLEVKEQPYARSILNKLLEPDSNIQWNPQYEIIIDKNTIPNTDIRKLLKHVLGYTINTAEADLPLAHEEFSEALLNLVPAVWLKIPERKAGRKAGMLVAKQLLRGAQKRKQKPITPLGREKRRDWRTFTTPIAGHTRAQKLARARAQKLARQRLAEELSEEEFYDT